MLLDVKTLLQIISAKIKRETQQDDKTMIMERTIQIVAGLSDHSKVQEILTNNFIGQLWNSLEHPPYLYMGDEYRFRHADGSNNVRDACDVHARVGVLTWFRTRIFRDWELLVRRTRDR